MSYFTDGIDRKYKITDKTAFKPISSYSKTAGYKVNIDKSVAMHQQQAEIEFKTISFILTPRMKYLDINIYV